jgi:hypothetical protein
LYAEEWDSLHGLWTTMITIIEHNDTGETKVMGEDHSPYSYSALNVPVEVANAVRAGFAMNVRDFDCRTTEWHDDEVSIETERVARKLLNWRPRRAERQN